MAKGKGAAKASKRAPAKKAAPKKAVRKAPKKKATKAKKGKGKKWDSLNEWIIIHNPVSFKRDFYPFSSFLFF